MTATTALPGADRAPATTAQLDISVIVPVSERPHDLAALYREVAPVLAEAVATFEFIFVLEPWHRHRVAQLAELQRAGEPIRMFVAGQSLGEGALFRAAVPEARADLLLVLPAYPRILAAGMRALLDTAIETGADVVVARRWPRSDGAFNRVQNRVFHGFLRATVGQSVEDVACGVRVVRRDVVTALPLYGDSWRFMPVLAIRDGFAVREVAVEQHPADRHARAYSPGVYVRRLLDLLGLFFLVRFVEKPLRFFGLLGVGAGLPGAAILVAVVIQRFAGRPLADRPLFVLGLLLVLLGVQAIALGLIGEVVVHVGAGRRRSYRAIEVGGDAGPAADRAG